MTLTKIEVYPKGTGFAYKTARLYILGIGKNIAKYRNNNELTQTQLAELAMVNVDYLRAIEEERRLPHTKTLTRVANALGVSIGDLLKED